MRICERPANMDLTSTRSWGELVTFFYGSACAPPRHDVK